MPKHPSLDARRLKAGKDASPRRPLATQPGRLGEASLPPGVGCVMTVNSGSSSIKFALYRTDSPTSRLVSGKIERIGLPKPTLTTRDGSGATTPRVITAPNHLAAGEVLIHWLDEHVGFARVDGIGHRVVHGGLKISQAQVVTRQLLRELRRISPYDPEHMPSGIQLMEVFHRRCPKCQQVACFDTAFHREMPRVAKLLPIPRRFDTKGVQRFGFHGLSYTYVMEELKRVAGAKEARGRLILAHLGNGASLAAVRNGKSIDTSMGFTPAAGIPMSTRSGDLDPGLFWYLARTQHTTGKQFHEMVHHQSGLLGVSQISPDMRDLLACEAKDVRAAEAVALFCYQVKKWIGGFAAALGGLDTIVFTGGIGENAIEVRARVCDGLQFLGVRLDAGKNKASASIISSAASKVAVRVIRTDEEVTIAKAVCRVLGLPAPGTRTQQQLHVQRQTARREAG